KEEQDGDVVAHATSGQSESRLRASRSSTVSRPISSSTASIEGVWAWPVTIWRSGMASCGIFRPLDFTASLIASLIAARCHSTEVEPLDQLSLGEDLLVAMRPAQAREVVEQRLRQEAFVAVLRDADGAVALGEPLAVRPENHGHMCEIWKFLV